MTSRLSLHTRWHRLTAPLVADEARREAEYEMLAAAYEAPGRHYHTLAHIEKLLDLVEQAELQDAQVVQLAAWFHDAVYEPLRSDNEALSAKWARTFLRESGLEPERQQRVAFLIERTQDHTLPQPLADADLLYFLDADLSVLGVPAADYWAYARQVRREYAVVPGAQYRAGRSQVLARLLAAPELFRTPVLRAALDVPARRNLQAELAAWEQGGLPAE